MSYPDLNLPFTIESNLTQENLNVLARNLSLPHLNETIRSIQFASDFYIARVLRKYLYDAIQQGFFEISSPLDGHCARSGHSIVLNDKTTFVVFDGFIVGIGQLAQGFPLAALILPAQRLFIKIVDDHWAVQHRHLESLVEVLQKHASEAPWEPGLDLLSGDPNFAHHVWNQLPALHAIIQHCDLKSSISLINTHEPLGPIRKIFPELVTMPSRHIPDVYLEQINAVKKLRLPIGSTFIPRSLVDRLLSTFNSYPRSRAEIELILRVMAHQSTVLWLSIRTRNRTPTNQAQVLVQIGCEYLARNPDGLIVLDGHSLADDFLENITYDKSAQRKIVEEGSALALAIANAITAQTSRPESVVIATGIQISQTILLAQRATVYFCHHGTVHHKVGWFSPAPGVVHSNKRTLETLALAQHMKDQSEVSTLPVYMHPELVDSPTRIESEDATDNEQKAENYRIVDVDKVSKVVLGLLDAKRTPETGATLDVAPPRSGRAAVIVGILVITVVCFLQVTATLFP